MKYDFTTVRDREALNSAKWGNMYAKKPEVPKEIIPFSVADMEFLNPPEIIKALTDWLSTGVLGYTKPGERYFQAVCGWMEQRHGLRVLQEQIVPCPGVVSALYYLVRTFTKEGEGVIVMPPIYGPFSDAAERTGRRLVKCPLKEEAHFYSMDFDLLEARCKQPENKVLLFCNPHNPGGRVWRREELERVADICVRNGVLIVSDEIHSDIIMPGYSHYSMGRIPGIEKSLVVCTAPSKTFNLAAMQTANIIFADAENCRRFREFMEDCHTGMMNALGFAACTAAYEQCEGWLEEMLSVVYENYCIVRDCVRERLPKIRVQELMGTYLAWLDFRAYGFSPEELDGRLTAQNLFFSEGEAFGSEGAGFMRMNLACPAAYVRQAMGRLEAALEG